MYQLLDFGNARKLERFGEYVLDRPAPAAEGARPSQPDLWESCSAHFERTDRTAPFEQGRWMPPGQLPDTWNVTWRGLTLELKPTPFGHIGLFAEHAENWDWLQSLVRRRISSGSPVKALNLFAYTGATTLAAAAAGAEVVHIDAAKNVVAWARRNATHSQLQHAPIRWIAEDALRFAARECKRGNAYDLIVLDPPSYGHGPQGQTWNLQRDLPTLLNQCARLLSSQPLGVLLTCHTPGYTPEVLQHAMQTAGLAASSWQWELGPLRLTAVDGRELHAGSVARWSLPD